VDRETKGKTTATGKSVREFDRDALMRYWRASGHSMPELARRAGVPRTQQLKRWIDGDLVPSAKYVPHLAAALGVPPAALTTTSPDAATLRDLRLWAGRTQRSLAERAGIGVPLYVSIEQAVPKRIRNEPVIVAALARALACHEDTVAAALARTRASRRR
jgi:transcriptional regulator with XRE-family HTH domain